MILNQSGLRELILARNKLTDEFAKRLQQALCYDKYIKLIDLAGNNISGNGLKLILKNAFMENNSIMAFDIRLNPGCSEKVQRQFALCMLKNIEKVKQKGIEINPNHLKPELYSYDIPAYILKALKLPRPGEKMIRPGSRARSTANTKSVGRQSQRDDNASAMGNSAFDAYNSGQINLDGLG